MSWNPKKIPIIGGYYSKIGKIYDISTMPCTPTPEVWTLAFFYGIPRLIWALFKPDPFDETWSRVGRKRGIKRKQTFKFIDEFTIPVETTPSMQWVRWAGDWVQRVGWWFLIVDTGVDHAVYWQSAAYAFEGCKTPGSPYAQASTTTPQQDTTGMNWKRAQLAVTAAHVFSGGVGEVFIPAGFGFHAGFTIQSEENQNFPPGQRATVTAWRIRQDDGTVIASGSTTPNKEGDKSSGAGFVKKPILSAFSKTLIFEYTCGSDGWTLITGISISVTGSGIPIGLGQGDP